MQVVFSFGLSLLSGSGCELDDECRKPTNLHIPLD